MIVMLATNLLPVILTLTAQDARVPEAREKPVIAALRRASRKAPAIVAHRGASSTHPENTVAAFRKALQQGVTMIEFDVRQTADDGLVCIHDATVDRTSDGTKRFGKKKVAVADLTLEQIRQLDAGSWKGASFRGERVPSLAQGLEAICQGAIPMIEHKAGDPALYVELLRRMKLLDKVLVQSFDWDFVAAIHRLEPRVAVGVLGPGDDARALTPEAMDRAAALGAGMVHWNAKKLRAEDVQELHRRGFLVCTYTTDDDAGLIGLAAMGVDAVTTNTPSRLQELIGKGLATRR